MRILFLGAGSSCHVLRWTRFLRKRGHEVALGTMHAFPEEERNHVFPLGDDLSTGRTSAKTLLRAVSRLRSYAGTYRADVVLAYYLQSYGLLGVLAGPSPIIGISAGGDVLSDPFDNLGHCLRCRLVHRILRRRVVASVCWSEHMADRLRSLGYQSESIFVQPRGVDLAEFPYRVPRHRQRGDPLRVLSLRALKPLYRVDTLIDALARLSRSGVAFEARIAGDGSLRQKLQAHAAAAGIAEQTEFLGHLDMSEIPAQIAWSDAYVSTSCTDGASCALFEALAVGSYPLVTNILANHPYIESGANGDLFEVGDDASLASCLALLAEDEIRRRRGIEASRSLVNSRLDYAQNMIRIEDFIAQYARHGHDAQACGAS